MRYEVQGLVFAVVGFKVSWRSLLSKNPPIEMLDVCSGLGFAK
jgi:hypothetical protein